MGGDGRSGGECLISKFVLVRHFRNDHPLKHLFLLVVSVIFWCVCVWFVGGVDSHDHEICAKFTDGSAILRCGRKAGHGVTNVVQQIWTVPRLSIARVV